MAEPVGNWTADYDIFSPEYVKDPFPIWDEIRGKCPIAHTERWGGSFMPTRYEDLFNIARDIENFSSRNVLVADVMPQPGEELEEEPEMVETYNVGAPPITSDPPVHTWARKLLLKPFSVTEVAEYEQETRELCNELIDAFIDKGRADGAVDYAQQIPPRVIASMLGIPKDMTATFTEWVRGFLELGLTNPQLRQESARNIFMFMNDQIQERKAKPGDDLITRLLAEKG
ncbi:MAG: hypothetical protein WD359_00820 [Dehalococcoidia bacterium]